VWFVQYEGEVRNAVGTRVVMVYAFGRSVGALMVYAFWAHVFCMQCAVCMQMVPRRVAPEPERLNCRAFMTLIEWMVT
jgi:hypothetical protein